MTKSIDTSAVHAGRETGASGFRGTSPVIELSSAFVANSVEQLYGVFRGDAGFAYSRNGNPTVHVLERALAELEGGDGAVAYGSGMAALHAAWLSCGIEPDDAIMIGRDCYGVALTLLREVLGKLGVRKVEADLCDLHAVGKLVRETRPKIIHCESISNPLLRVADLPALAQLAREVGAKIVLDATFASPVLFRGLEHGVDVVVHSLTKYLAGHGDVMGGACLANDSEMIAHLRQATILAGAVLSPFDAWLTLRGLRTLPLRMRKHCENAMIVAEWLRQHPRIARVHYPGLASHPQHEVAARILNSNSKARPEFGGMVAFEIAGGKRQAVMRFMNALKLIQPATTLGDVWSLTLYPAETSHRDLTADELQAAGISQGLVRLSVGIEDSQDIIADLEQALAQL